MTACDPATVRSREYPGPPDGVFLNAASYGLIPRSAAEAAADLTLRRTLPRGFTERELGAIQRRCRTAAARLVGVEAREIALSPNTSYGVNLAAALVARGPTGGIVVSEGEFPANVLPWMMLVERGFRVDVIPADDLGRPVEERLLAALDGPDVRALALSSVQFSTGHRADLARMGAACRDRGVLFAVDAIQEVGVAPLDARLAGVDVLACGGQKWLCAPWGSGFTYIAADLSERFPPPMVSWLSVRGGSALGDPVDYRLDFRPGARRHELATLATQDFLGLARSIEILLDMGLDVVRSHVLGLHRPLIEWARGRGDVALVTPAAERQRAGILSLTMPWLDEAAAALRAAGVVFAVRQGVARFAPHFYNTVDEIARVVDVLDALPSAGAGC